MPTIASASRGRSPSRYPLAMQSAVFAARGGRLLRQDDSQADRARLTADAALLLWQGIGLLVRHALDHAARATSTIGLALALVHGLQSRWRAGNASGTFRCPLITAAADL